MAAVAGQTVPAVLTHLSVVSLAGYNEDAYRSPVAAAGPGP